MRRCQDLTLRTKFLHALSMGCTKSEAAEVTGCTPYQWREECKKDAEFAELVEYAHKELGADVLEAEARRRAVDGVAEPVFYQGTQVGTVQKYSDTLLMFLLKSRKPEAYAETTRDRVLQQSNETEGQAELEERIRAGRKRVSQLRLVAGTDTRPPAPDDEALQ